MSLQDEFTVNPEDESGYQELGRRMYLWMDQTANIRIRPQVTEPYVMRASFHILADKNPPQVWWHPKFIERLEQLLPIS